MKAFEVLCNASRWCRAERQGCVRSMAQRRDGRYVEADDPKAVAWTVTGAINLCHTGMEYLLALRKLWEVIGTRKVSEWADDPSRSFAEVQQALQMANI